MSTAAATPDPRAAKMTNNPERYFREARQRARLAAQEATRRERELAKRKKASS
jgi:hypothetical protein